MEIIKKSLVAVTVLVFALFSVIGIGEADEPWENYDFEGETITVSCDSDPIIEMLEDPDDEQEAHLDWVEDAFNVKIEADKVGGHWSDEPEYWASGILAGDPIGDIMYTYPMNMQKMAANDLLHPLDDVIDEDYLEKIPSYHRNHQENYQVQGVTYGLQSLAMPSPDIIWWNKDLFDREGLPDLHELWKDGEWTFETFRDVADELTADTDGDGEIDRYGFVNHPDAVQRFQYANKALPVRFDEDKEQYVSNLTSSEVETAAQWQRDLLDDGLWMLGQDVEGNNEELLMEGKVGMTTGSVGSGGVFEESDDLIAMVPFPKGPDADEYTAWAWNMPQFFFPVTADNIEGLVELTNAIFELTSDYQDIDNWWDEEKEELAMNVYDRESMEVQDWAIENAFIRRFGWLIEGEMRFDVVLPEADSDIPSALAEIEPELESKLSDLLGYE